MEQRKSFVWRGPDLNLNPPKVPEGGGATRVKAGAPVVILEADEHGALVAFPPAPFNWRLPRDLWEHVHDETPAAEEAEDGAWDGETLTPEMLLQVLQHPNAIQAVTTLVETRGDEAKAAVMPLLNPLMSALVPADKLPMVQAALAMFVK